ncbi:MAG: UbiA family prenyltransferase [Leptospiraceae bacterium]|nr:putative 4-hydroxybenzoate polyprenyltransferase [Leptospiraceae bacterium]MCP5511702.1 UbiA family prenyltransferase [Leptospiraceae bacterium]
MSFFQTIYNYGKMVKFSHTLFALPFAGFSVLYAILEDSKSNLYELGIKSFFILICMVSARNAAMGFNRYVDKEIDARNPRTQNREIPAGILSENSVLYFTIFFSFIFVLSTYFINQLSFYLSIPTLMIVLFYSYTKRFTWLCHFVLGLGIGIAPSGAWIAIRDELSLLPALWSFGLMFHIAGFDILYSIQDYEFDRSQNLYSIPGRFGIEKALWIARISHLISFSLLVYSGIYGDMGLPFFLFLCITGILFSIEHLLVKKDDFSKIPIAFFHINASISIILFLGVLLDKWDLLVSKFSGGSL